MSASASPPPPAGGETDDETAEAKALLAVHSRALSRLHSSVEHHLRSPLNSIGLNLELLAVEIADLVRREDRDDRGDRDGGENRREAYSSLAEVLAALRGGYARLIGNADTVLDAVLPGNSERVEALDLAKLARRIAALGETESVLLRATWRTEIPPVPVTLEARRDLIVTALLLVVSSALEHAGAESRIAFSLSADSKTAEIRAEVEPCRDAERTPTAQDCGHGLTLLARRLGGSCQESANELVFRLHLSLPRLFGADAC
jgi:signal transduction histidine kinase